MAFAAKYPGKCTLCGEKFPAGVLINWAGKGNAQHAECAKASPERIVESAPELDKDAIAWAAFQATYVPLPGEGVFVNASVTDPSE